MSAPGVGPITALAFRATIDRPPLQAVARCRRASRPNPRALSIRRNRHSRSGQPMRRRTRPHRALRGCPHAARAQPQVVEPAAGLGNADRQAPRHGARSRRGGAQTRRDPAPHVERRRRVPLRQGTGACNGMKSEKKEPSQDLNRIVPVGTMGRAISLRVSSREAQACKVVKQIETPCSLTPSCGGRAPTAKRSE